MLVWAVFSNGGGEFSIHQGSEEEFKTDGSGTWEVFKTFSEAKRSALASARSCIEEAKANLWHIRQVKKSDFNRLRKEPIVRDTL